MTGRRLPWLGRTVLALAFVLGLAACESPEPQEDAAPATPDIAAGQQKYRISCGTCHGDDGEGIEGLGKPLRGNEFVRNNDPAAIVAMVEEGRDASHPQNTTGIAMPPKGGNVALTKADLRDIVAFLKTL